MDANEKHQKLERYFAKEGPWHDAYNELRAIIKETPLEEDYKWMHPCYTLKGKNVVLIHGFKEYCALLFHKGVLLPDTEELLIQQTKDVQAARQLRFVSADQIKEQRDIIKQYVLNAIEVEKSGKEVEMKKHEDFEMPDTLKEALAKDAALEEAFYNLTPGRQRAYMMQIGKAKRIETQISRIEKYRDNIFDGKGWNE